MIAANLQLAPNLMLEQSSAEAEIQYLPGDFAFRVYEYVLFSRRELISRFMTDKQKMEYRQYLACDLCGKPCAGSCEQGQRPR
jgi:hypothetical protein